MNYPRSGAFNDEELAEECMKEFKARELNPKNLTRAAIIVNLTKEPTPTKPVKLTEAIDCERFSDATRLFRVTAFGCQETGEESRKTKALEEIRETKSLWIRKNKSQ